MRLAILAQNIAVKKERADGRPPPEKAHWAVAERMLEMATLGGARALFMEDRTGAIEVGKAADCVMVDLAHAATPPPATDRRPTGALAGAGTAVNVEPDLVAGRRPLSRGRRTVVGEEPLREREGGKR